MERLQTQNIRETKRVGFRNSKEVEKICKFASHVAGPYQI